MLSLLCKVARMKSSLIVTNFALVTLGLSLMFKTTVNFLCDWQFNGDACPSDHSVR